MLCGKCGIIGVKGRIMYVCHVLVKALFGCERFVAIVAMPRLNRRMVGLNMSFKIKELLKR